MSGVESPNPHKRSRSSKTDSSIALGSGNAGTTSIATQIGGVGLDSTDAEGELYRARRDEDHISGKPHTNPLPGPPPRPKTTRIDKQARMTEADRMQRERQRHANQMEWRKRFLRAFPNFRFYLDGFDQASKAEVTLSIEQLGATVEPFFSRTATHLITARKVSLPATTNADGAQDATHEGAKPSPYRLSHLPALRKKQTQIPLHSDRNPFEECGPPVSANDILVKARSFGIKVWNHDKFRTVVNGLLGDPGSTDAGKQQNLSQMLEKEKLLGTLERDPATARNDFYYFSRNAIFLLIDDATSEHRPIMMQEWPKPVGDESEVPWPVLHGELEGRCPFTKFDLESASRKKPKPNRHETLRRSVSLNHVRTAHPQRVASLSPAPFNDSRGGYSVVRGASPYPLASGNSVSVASNIASTTSTAVGSAAGLGLLSPFGPLSRQVKQATDLGLGRPSALPSNFASRRRTIDKTDQTHGALTVRMLPDMTRRSISTPSNAQNARREKRPGFCENCRVKYEDFGDHIHSRRHRKFAKDESNFADIDELLRRVARPMAPWAAASVPSSTCSSPDTDAQHLYPPSSLVAAGGSLDEAVGDQCDLHDSDAAMEVIQDVTEAVRSWQKSTAHVARIADDQEVPAKKIQVDMGDVDESIASVEECSVGAATAGQNTERSTLSPHTSPQMSAHDQDTRKG